MEPRDVEGLAGVRLHREAEAPETGTLAWTRLAAFAERVSRQPPDTSDAPDTSGCPLRSDREGEDLPPVLLEQVAPEFRNGLLLVPRIL